MFGIDVMIEKAIPGIVPYLYPWGIILVLGVGYVYLRLRLDGRTAPDEPKMTMQERLKERWKRLSPLMQNSIIDGLYYTMMIFGGMFFFLCVVVAMKAAMDLLKSFGLL